MLSFIALVTLFLTCLQTAYAKCKSYGLDYQDGKSYSMVRSSSAFSGHEEFKGCDNDQANNVLVDPNGNEYQCSMTPLQPDSTSQEYVCNDWTYDSMYTGEWSIIVISNNGNGDPVNFQRDFYLDFGDGSGATASATSTSSSLLSETTLLSSISEATLESTLTSLSSISLEVSNPAETSAAETTKTFAITLFGRDLPALPTTLVRVVKRNETEAWSASYSSEKKAEPTTTLDVTLTSTITSFFTVHPTHDAVHVPLKSMRPLSGWNGTSTHSSTWLLASSLATAAPSTTKTVTVFQATPTPESSSSTPALATPTLDGKSAEDHVAPIAPTSLGKQWQDLGHSVADNHAHKHSNSTSGAYSQKFRLALLNGDKPDDETRRQFVEERHRVLHGN